MLVINDQINFDSLDNIVFGGAGFIGSHLVDRLLAMGENVLCIDNFHTGLKKNISHLENERRFFYLEHDIIQPIKSKLPIKKIWHLASPASPSSYQKNPLQTIRTNYEGTFNILNLANDFKSKLLFTSSSEIYGVTEVSPQSEKMPILLDTNSPRASYSEGKRVAETLLKVYGDLNNLQVRIARLFNTYGPRYRIDDGRVIINFINQALKNKKLTIYGDGSQTRSFCYVSDMVTGLIKLMDSTFKEPINLGNDHEISILELANFFKNRFDSEIHFEFHELPKDDPKFRRPSLYLARKYLGWEPKVNLSEGLEKTFLHYKR